MIRCPFAILGLLTFAAQASSNDHLTPEQVRFFESRIRPMLADHCLACHGEKVQKSGLRLDSRVAMLKGGARGATIVPGEPEQSRLIAAIRRTDATLAMPPDAKLSERQIADLVVWIKQGAYWPELNRSEADSGKPERHWAFQPVQRPTVPRTRTAQWSRSPLDQFILAKLEAEGLKPALPADRLTLIRRSTLDLIGLPPTPSEVDAFLTDRSPDAFERVIDRLLASPAYGEKWGRHWLDVARYADSNGLDENIAHGNAWRYRDYVVAALNADQPFDRFLTEQIAGDLLPYSSPAQRHQQLIATGFLSLGPKVLAEVDQAKMEMDIIDEQLDTLARATMALTLGCARCHNHKFDPVSTEDYYGLAGIFKSTKTMENFKIIARWWENPIAQPHEQASFDAHAQRVQSAKDAVAALIAKAKAELMTIGKPVPTAAAALEAAFPEATRNALKRLRDEQTALEKAAPELPMAMGVGEREATDLRVHLRGSHLNLGATVARRFPVVLVGPRQDGFDAQNSGRLRLAEWIVNPQHPLTARVLANRLWRWHFGRGLVATTDNFGLIGDQPTHPELLDWLATQVVEQGWSLKQMHRLIMRSATYQMSAEDGRRSAEAKDTDNRWLHHYPTRRLQAEELRDSLLAVSGRLDRSMGGSLLHVKNREFFFDHTSKDTTKYDSLKRTLYLPIVRNHLYDVLQLFDATDAAVGQSERTATTVPTQALFFLNSELMTQSARALATSLLAQAGSDDQRVTELYRRAYGRSPAATEVARAKLILARFERASPETEPVKRREAAWTSLCQIVMAANEFVTVR